MLSMAWSAIASVSDIPVPGRILHLVTIAIWRGCAGTGLHRSVETCSTGSNKERSKQNEKLHGIADGVEDLRF